MTGGPLPLALLGWKELRRNTLRGFATVRLGRSLKIADVAVHCSHGKRWASLPGKPMLDRDGNPKRNEAGKVVYSPVLEWSDKETADRFSGGVVELVERAHPGATTAAAGDLEGAR